MFQSRNISVTLTASSGMSFNSCFSVKYDRSDIHEERGWGGWLLGFKVPIPPDLLLLELWLKTPAVEQLREKTFPTPVFGSENLTCFSPSDPVVDEAPCEEDIDGKLKANNNLELDFILIQTNEKNCYHFQSRKNCHSFCFTLFWFSHCRWQVRIRGTSFNAKIFFDW